MSFCYYILCAVTLSRSPTDADKKEDAPKKTDLTPEMLATLMKTPGMTPEMIAAIVKASQ